MTPPKDSGCQDLPPMSDREVELATSVARLEGHVQAAETATQQAVDRIDARLTGEVQSILDNLKHIHSEIASLRSLLVGANGQNGLQSRVGKLETASDMVRHGPQVPVEVHTAMEALKGRCDALEGLEKRGHEVRLRWAVAVFTCSVGGATGLMLLLLRIGAFGAP